MPNVVATTTKNLETNNELVPNQQNNANLIACSLGS
jgi:hypothetical protein